MFWVIKIEMHGTILDINPGSLLQYTLRNSDGKEDPDNFSTVTDVLREANGVTTLAVTDDVGSADGWEDRLEKSEHGWDKVLNGLKRYVEGGR